MAEEKPEEPQVAPNIGTYPPYPPYEKEPAAPSVANTITAGRDMRIQFKVTSDEPARPPPLPAKSKGPKPKDVKLSRRAALAQSRCLRRHGAVLTDRLEYMSKPPRRQIIHLWREYADRLPAETVSRFRSMLDADEPFKPGQAYEYFINLRRAKKLAKSQGHTATSQKKDILSIYSGDKRFLWARNASVAFAKGVQQRLAKPGCYYLADGMLRLSNIILNDLCGFMHMKTPSRKSRNPKSKFMMEMSDKIAIWIDELLSESEDRMLMMDFDEDDDVSRSEVDESRPASTAASTPAETPGVTPSATPGASPVPSAPGSPVKGSPPPAGSPLPPGSPVPPGSPPQPGSPPLPPGSPPPPGSPAPPPGSPAPPPGSPPPPPGSPALPPPGSPPQSKSPPK